MKLDLIREDPHVARRKFLEYRRAVRDRHSAEDQAMMRGYKALSKGQQLIRLSETVIAGGTEVFCWRREREKYATTVPRLAVARASAIHVWTYGVNRSGEVEMRTKREVAPSNRKDRTIVSFARDESREQPRNWGNPAIRAIVPSIPPALRPAHSLDGYHILFEAEWGIDPQPPVDPALLKQVGGDLYAVVAVWDLSPLEQAVLAGTRA